jgi:hypothetical protein
MPDTTAAAARTARFCALLARRPDLTTKRLAEDTGKSPKTIQMWRVGRKGSIPELSLRYLEALYARGRARA